MIYASESVGLYLYHYKYTDVHHVKLYRLVQTYAIQYHIYTML